MSDQPPVQNGEQPVAPLMLNIQFTKDLSFEVPGAPASTPTCASSRGSTWRSTCRPARWRKGRTSSR
jgi:hypothetical protein